MTNTSIDSYYAEGDLAHIPTYQAGILQASINRILQKHSDKILNPFGVTKMQWLIIGSVLESGEQGIRLTDLAKKLGTTMSYITTAVNLLESKKVLTRVGNKNDSRSKLISIDKAFVPQCALIETTLRQSLRKTIYARIDPADFRTYMKVMHQLSKVGK